MKVFVVGLALAAAAVVQAPAAQADMNIGNYDVIWSPPRAWDFHTYVIEFTRCFEPTGRDPIPGCLKASMNPRPIAKATQWRSQANLVDGRWVLEVDNPLGLSCGGYYSPTTPTRDVYNWDPVTLSGTMTSSFAAGPCGGPGGAYVYPFTFVRL